MNEIKVFQIRKPDWQAVREGTTGQELLVFFMVNGNKYQCKYIQEHYFYRGMPGYWTEQCHFYKLEEGEAKYIANCSGQFKIPHEGRFSPSGYDSNNYRGDDKRFLEPTEEIVLKYLIEPFVDLYF